MPIKKRKSAKELAEIKRYNKYHIKKHIERVERWHERRRKEEDLRLKDALKDVIKYFDKKPPANDEQARKRAAEVARYYGLQK